MGNCCWLGRKANFWLIFDINALNKFVEENLKRFRLALTKVIGAFDVIHDVIETIALAMLKRRRF